MSFFSGGKLKDKENSKVSQFYVEFLGWMECRGLRGQRHTEPVIRELRRRHRKMGAPPKLTIQVSRKDLKITQELEEKPKKSIKKIKFPIIPARDVTFVHQAARSDGRLDDIVACIYLGYMPRTQKYVHVHVYRFDEANTASLFASQMALIVEDNLFHIREVETSLVNEGEIDNPKLLPEEQPKTETYPNNSAAGSASSGNSDESPTSRNTEIEADLESLFDVQNFDSVTDELKHRLYLRDTPLLLPPKDYDTIRRAHGNLEEANKRRCQNENIVGLFARDRNNSNESGVDLVSPESDALEKENKISIDKAFLKTQNLADETNFPNMSPLQKRATSPLTDFKNSPQIVNKPIRVDSPQITHKPLKVDSPQIVHKPLKVDSPQLAPKLVRPDSIFPKTGFNPENSSPDIEHKPVLDYVYPPKPTNSPMSPRMFPQSPKLNVSRQSSQNSFQNESPRLSHRSDEGRVGQQIQHFKYGSNDDIYALPLKAPKQIPVTDDLPPDYQDDDELPQLTRNQLYGDSYLDRSLPTDLLRNKLNQNRSRPNSEDLRHGRWAESPVLGKGQGPAPQGNRGMYSPDIQRHGSSKR